MLSFTVQFADAVKKAQERSINAIPLHDGVIYDAKDEGTVERIMKGAYESFTGNEIAVKTS